MLQRRCAGGIIGYTTSTMTAELHRTNTFISTKIITRLNGHQGSLYLPPSFFYFIADTYIDTFY